MSAALLKKSLELCDTPFVVVSDSDKRELHYRSLSNKSKNKKTQRGVSDVERKNITCIEQVKKKRHQEKQKTRAIVRKLNVLKKQVIDKKLAKNIVEATKKRGERDREIINLKNKPEHESVFTEEDFAKFEREYAVDS